jgi:hypothetical protein
MRLAVRIEAQQGELVLGDTRVPVADAGTRGELRIGGADGPVLRPVRFGERTRAAVWAASSAMPRDNLCAALVRAATVVEGVLDPTLRELAVLALAGAGEPHPPYSQTVLRLAQAAGWSPAQIAEAEAAEVDRLTAALTETSAGAAGETTAEAITEATTDGGWQRLVWEPEPLLGLRDELADRLLTRVVSQPSQPDTTVNEAEPIAMAGAVHGPGGPGGPGSGWFDGVVPAAAASSGERVPGPAPAFDGAAPAALRARGDRMASPGPAFDVASPGPVLDESWGHGARRGWASWSDPNLVLPVAGPESRPGLRALGSTEHPPRPMERAPFSTERTPSSTEFAPFSTEYAPSSTEYAPSSTEYAPSSTERAPFSIEHSLFSTEHPPLSRRREAPGMGRSRPDGTPRSEPVVPAWSGGPDEWIAAFHRDDATAAAAVAIEPRATRDAYPAPAARFGAHLLETAAPSRLAEPPMTAIDTPGLADALAELLDDESDLRGLLR